MAMSMFECMYVFVLFDLEKYIESSRRTQTQHTPAGSVVESKSRKEEFEFEEERRI